MAILKAIGKDASTGQEKTYKAGDTFAAGLESFQLAVSIDNAGSVLVAGEVRGYFRVKEKCVITKVTLLASPSGSVVVDIWKDTYANFPPTNADSICAAAKPTISSGTKYEDSTLTGWTTAVAAGDVLRVEVESAATVTEATLILEFKKTT